MSTDALLQPGASTPVPEGTHVLTLDVRWNTGTQTAFGERLAVAALPLARGRLTSREDLVFDNQPVSPEGAIRLSTRADIVDVDLGAVPRQIERIEIVVYVRPRPNAPRRTLDQLDGLSLSLRDGVSDEVLATSGRLQELVGPAMAATVADILRTPDGWSVIVQAREHESGLDGAAATAGMRL